jgi:hypothetical protein
LSKEEGHQMRAVGLPGAHLWLKVGGGMRLSMVKNLAFSAPWRLKIRFPFEFASQISPFSVMLFLAPQTLSNCMPDEVPILAEPEIMRLIHDHIRSLFPKTCPKCQRRFATYRDYLAGTKPVGVPVSYDLEMGDVKPADNIGNLSLANCDCGNTLALSSEGMPVADLWKVLKWVKLEMQHRRRTLPEMLTYVREQVVKLESTR